MKSARLWPMVLALGAFLAGTVATEVIARRSEGRLLSWEISGSDLAVDGEAQDSDDELDEALVAAEAVNGAHADARVLARRGDYKAALARFREALEAAPEAPALWSEYGHWLRRAKLRPEADEALARALALDPKSASAHLDRALLAHEREDRRAALASFEEALRLRPNHAGTRIAFGKALLDEKRFDEAIAMIDPATKSGSNDGRSRALAALGHAYTRADRYKDARAAYEQAIERAPAVAVIWARAAIDLSASGDPETAAEGLRYAQQAARLAPDSAYIAVALGRAYERAGLESEAYAAYQSAVKLDPGARLPRQRLVRLAIDREDWGAARRGAQSLLEVDPSRAESHFLMGLVEFKAGNLDDARLHFDEAIRASNEPYAEAWYNLGVLERKADKPDAAIAAYQKAIEARPGYLAAINNLGLVYSDLGRHEEAEARFREALAKKADYPSAWVNLARTLSARGRNDEALAAYRKALEIDPNERSAQLQVAVTLRRMGRADEAIAEYRSLLEKHPRYVKAWFNLGIALAAEGHDDEALDAYERALELDKEHLGARKNLGLLLLRLDRFEAAREHLDEALELRPADAETRLALARIARHGGDASGCKSHVDAVLRQKADDGAALALLETCANPESKE